MSDKKVFSFKQFDINQQNSAMKVGTDGVMLGAWFSCSISEKILDVGTGTGLIALMLTQRCSATIDAIDIDSGAIADALSNFENSPWSSRLTAIHSGFTQFVEATSKKYDGIVCNPPFFSHSLKPEHESRKLARHNDMLPFSELIKGAVKLLNYEGLLGVVLPANREQEFRHEAGLNGFFPVRITRVKPNAQKEVKRVLMEFGFSEGGIQENTLILETEVHNVYTDEYKKLVHSFYLNM